MKRMCRYIFKVCALSISLLIVNSCTKNADPGPDNSDSYYIKFKLNNERKEYNMLVYAKFDYDEEYNTHNGYMLASLTSDPTKEVLSFFLYDTDEYQVGKEYNVKNEVLLSGTNMKVPELTLVHIDKDNKSYTAQFPDSPTLEALGINHKAQLIFSEITEEYVKGTFSATAYSEFPENEEFLITEGEFYLKRN